MNKHIILTLVIKLFSRLKKIFVLTFYFCWYISLFENHKGNALSDLYKLLSAAKNPAA